MNEPNEIETRHRKQLSTMRGWLEGRGYYEAAGALELVHGLEQGLRKDQATPKFHHQLSVARLISTLAPHLMHPEETLTACFLHDLLEDHGDVWDRNKVQDRFGKTIAEAVWALSKKTNGMSKNYDYYFAGMTNCPIASIVKLADRAHNLQTMPGVFTVEKQKAYLAEVDQWFYPMIRQARRNFPRQYPAYENLKILLRCQTRLIQLVLEAGPDD
jgi:(p)ppGpp synthase/HD superfamily hydrolase